MPSKKARSQRKQLEAGRSPKPKEKASGEKKQQQPAVLGAVEGATPPKRKPPITHPLEVGVATPPQQEDVII